MKALSVLTVAAFAQAAEYGVDCSFPIHRELTCGDLLGDRQSIYDHYMQGCRERYSADLCDEGEDMRLEMNLRQPQSMVNFTSAGFKKIRAPESLQKMLSKFWENNEDNDEEEVWGKGNIYTNHWESPTYMLHVQSSELGGGEELTQAISTVARENIEEWTGMRLRSTSVYGIRVYTEGAILSPHVDRMPLVSSAIVNVAQDVDEDWPIEVYDKFGKAVNITMEPGDMVLYESGSVLHGRPFPLRGRFYANIFIHFEPFDSLDGDEFVNEDDQNLPPYIIADSPEAENWLEEHNSWSKVIAEDDLSIHILAGTGKLDALKNLAEVDARILHRFDDNGWQPLHEAVRAGHVEVVKYLVEKDVDINTRTHEGVGQSPLNIAKYYLGFEHPIYNLLLDLGAEDIEADEYDGESDEEETWYEEERFEEEEYDESDFGIHSQASDQEDEL